MKQIAQLFFMVMLITFFGSVRAALAATDYVRVNQIGYLTSDTKVAMAFANSSLSTLSFSIVQASNAAVLWGPTSFPTTSTSYAPFSDLYQLDFSSYQPSSAVTCYVLLSDGTKSVNFQVGPCVYNNTEETALNFFRAQNCGTGNWYEGGGNGTAAQCHMAPGTAGFTSDKDGIVVDGPNKGTQIDVEGGIHDSGDWIKFMITSAWVDEVLMFSYQENPTVFQDTLGSNLQASSPNGVPDVLDEARYILDWIIKMNPNSTTFYYDVADGRDHDNFGNLPQDDTENYDTTGANEGNGDPYGAVTKGYRAVYGGTNDQGGTNNAARAAGALAMGYQIWSATGTSFQDTTFAASCLTHAQQLYALAKSQNSLQNDVDDFYDENDMNPELEMAAVQLYKATGTGSYLTDAISYASKAGSADGELDWNQNNFLAHYCLYSVSPTTTVLNYMKADLNADLTISNANAYGQGYGYVWGTNENLSSLVMMCELWKKLNPSDTTYDKMATFSRDFILGRNPWGVCFVQGMGTTYPLHPQHNIAMAIYPTMIPGMPIEGPDTYKEYKGQGISLSNGTDPFGAFDNNATGGGWCYHDDNEDYVTNEVTTSQACFFVNIMADQASLCTASGPTNTPTKTATATITNTPSNTATKTVTSTVTPTVTSSATSTATKTVTPTVTFTYTSTSTNSSTFTSTSTSSKTPTSTFTLTFTFTPTYTSTPISTATFTPSPTLTNTGTLPPTLTFTSTVTFTSTSTFTNTTTNTVPFTATNTLTQTVTATVTNTRTPSFTATNTYSSTLTSTSTATAPNTATFTFTNTRTATPTPTNTPTAVPPTFTNTVTATMTATLTKSPTATVTSTATSTNSNTFTATPKATNTFTPAPTKTFTATATSTATTASGCAGIPAWNGNFVAYTVGQKVTYSNMLYQCIQSHTSEPNWEPNVVPALWKNLGACNGTTTALTNTPPVVFPNPVTSDNATIALPVSNATNVSVHIYTVSMREVQTTNVAQVIGNDLPVRLVDKNGMTLADGLYYFQIKANGQSWITKVLVLR